MRSFVCDVFPITGNREIESKIELMCVQVCQTAFEWLYDVSHPTKIKLVNEVKNGYMHAFARAKSKRTMNQQTASLISWLEVFFRDTCDIMPMCENQNGSTHRHLPTSYTRTMILEKYNKEMMSRGASGMWSL